MSAVTGVPVSSWVISSGKAATASRRVSRIAGERVSVLSSTRLTRFSIDQANSPRSRAPTMRPLPLRVWNERRTVTSASRSSGFWSHTGKLCWIFASSSRASSMNSFTSSGSACSASAGSFGRRGGERRGGGIDRGGIRAHRHGMHRGGADLYGLGVGARLQRRHRGHRRGRPAARAPARTTARCRACTTGRCARPAASPCSTRRSRSHRPGGR